MNKLVSIILPVFNGEKYLSESIDSVLAQTYHDFELIIVNDCSTDSTEDIILAYKAKDTRIVYIKNEVNSKLPASLNNGFRAARGEYYTWTSDDNLYHPDAIEKMVRYLETHPETAMVSCDYNVINENAVYQNTVSVGTGDLIISNNVGACFLYRASVAKEIGDYRTDLFLVEDYDYWLRISQKSKIEYYHEVLYEYRQHGGNLSTKRKAEVLATLEKYMWSHLPEYEKSNISDEQLFNFFDHLLWCKTNVWKRIPYRIWFGIRHVNYIKSYIRRKMISR